MTKSIPATTFATLSPAVQTSMLAQGYTVEAQQTPSAEETLEEAIATATNSAKEV